MKLQTIAISALALAISGGVWASETQSLPKSYDSESASGYSSTNERQSTDPGSAAVSQGSSTSQGVEDMQINTGQMTPNTYDFRASNVIGKEIKNPQDETVGEIDDLIVTDDNNVVYAIVSVGGFLGLGEKLVAVPYKELKVNKKDDETVITYNVTKEELKSRPERL